MRKYEKTIAIEQPSPSEEDRETAKLEWNKENPSLPFDDLPTRKKNSLTKAEMFHRQYRDLANAIMNFRNK